MDGVKPVRRIVCIDNAEGRSEAIADGPAPDVRTDPARPGFASTRIWVTDATPARMKGIRDSLQLPHTLEPPPRGSVCRIVTFPPDAVFRGKVGAREVEAYFRAMGSPQASTFGPKIINSALAPSLNAGHTGSPGPLGSPDFAKFTQ